MIELLSEGIAALNSRGNTQPKPERVEPTTLAPTAPPIRVERCIDADVFGQVRYADGWLCIWGDGGSDWCPHLTWRAAMDCALDRARARALGILGRW